MIYKEEGVQGFYAQKRTRGSAVLTDEVLQQAQKLLSEGRTLRCCGSTARFARHFGKSDSRGTDAQNRKKNQPCALLSLSEEF